MPNVLEFGKLSQDYGSFVVLFLFIGIVATGFLLNYLRVVVSELRESSSGVKIMNKSLGIDKKDAIADLSLIGDTNKELKELSQELKRYIEKANKHFVDTEHLSGLEKYQDCDVTKCIHILKVTHAISEVVRRFDEFDSKAIESRIATGTTLDNIQDEMKVLGGEISSQSKQMVTILTDLLKGELGRKGR